MNNSLFDTIINQIDLSNLTVKHGSEFLAGDISVKIVPDDLAILIGVDQTMMLCQIDFWIQNHKDDEHFRDGRYWIYESYDDWKKQFPYWGKTKIREIIRKLKEKGLIITGNYNKMSGDNTKWYAVDYDLLDKMISQKKMLDDTHLSESDTGPLSESDTWHLSENGRPIPNISYITKTSKPKTSKQNSISIEHFMQNAPMISDLDDYMNHVEKVLDTDANDEICIAIRWFFEKYEDFTGHPHIMLKLSTVADIADDLVPYSDCLKDMMIKYYKDKASKEYCGLPHFASEKMLAILSCEIGRPELVQNRMCLVN